ncbi:MULTISPECIES: AAA family ATPase [Viridibacillus]|uniref:AAA family ATPase n=1 Tax=Viridibacillus TaxID=496496 RepID=UPI0004B722B3
MFDSLDIKGIRQNSIALIGQPGVGKTHLLMAVANNSMKASMVSIVTQTFFNSYFFY